MMEKISLKDVKNSLKRDEMIRVSGGCGYWAPECSQECSSHLEYALTLACPRCMSGHCKI